ncbi:MAG: FAD-dependent oxidoreductase [Gammaproteobacteria bacterium]|jgi:glycerol-3-phosphate dehydrogenase
MTDSRYDVIVVGGGIHGAGVAQAAAARGYSVLLLEQSGIASTTSSKSSKLIHGGLRYLETLQFSLVRECLRERDMLLANAPELVKLVPFYIPVYRQTARRSWKITTGLTLYRLLNGWSQESRFSRLAQRQWQELAGLRQQDLQCVFQYYDAQTDDAALTKAVLQSAQQLGAHVKVPARLAQAEIHDQGCILSVAEHDRTSTYECRVLINAAGPWVNRVLQHCRPSPATLDIEYVQGTHIVLPDAPMGGVFYLEALQDQRAIFVMPWKQHTLIGTTETVYRGAAEDVKPLEPEIQYLLETYQHYFPGGTADRDSIIDSFAGLRVLPASAGSSFSRSRDTRLLTDNTNSPHLISVYGGKLTAYRSTAQRVIQLVGRSLPARKARADTRTLPLVPAD